MTGKKNEGLDAFRDTTGGKRREDRASIGKNILDPITIDCKNTTTVMYLLKSPEDNVKLRAVASLELFGRKAQENLKLLHSIGICVYLLPLCLHEDNLIKRFSFKLIAMLCSVEEFREEMIKMENVPEMFVNTLKKETDNVLKEFAALTLARLTNDYKVASELLNNVEFIENLFERITSADPDIQKNCLDIIKHLLDDINGVEIFLECPQFDMKKILLLVFSNYPAIQIVVIDIFTQLTSWCKDTRVLFLFRDVMGVEIFLQVLEKDEWSDLHLPALEILMNVADCPEMCDYLLKSGCLQKLISLLDVVEESGIIERLVGLLARIAQTKKGREILHSVEIETRFIELLRGGEDSVKESACLGLANLAQNIPALGAILEAKPMKSLLGIVINNEKNAKLRSMAAYTMNILSNADKEASANLMENEEYKGLFSILTDSHNLPTELCQNVIQVFVGISLCRDLRISVIGESFLSALMSCLPHKEASKDPSLQVDALDCLSEYMIEPEARSLFLELDGHEVLLKCLKSRFASVREWAGYLLVVTSQDMEFVKSFLEIDGLDWMLKEKNTMYSMPSWQSAIEMIFSTYLPAKFAYTGRLDFQDVTTDGFFIMTNPKSKFVVLDFYIRTKTCPISDIYVINFNNFNVPERGSAFSSAAEKNPDAECPSSEKTCPLKTYLWRGSSTSDSEEVKIQEIFHSMSLEDPNIGDCLENLKKRITKSELQFGDTSWSCLHPQIVQNRAKVIAEVVAEEMSGPEPEPNCGGATKVAHIFELKCFMGTNIFPLGLIRAGHYLERAMLFKALADRVGFPCALVRGSEGRAWIEVAVPVINVDPLKQEESVKEKTNTSVGSSLQTTRSSEITVAYKDVPTSITQKSVLSLYPDSIPQEGDFLFPKLQFDFHKGFPTNFLKPNAIVDLVKEPGRLLNINSLEAEEYCGTFFSSKLNEKVTNFTLL